MTSWEKKLISKQCTVENPRSGSERKAYAVTFLIARFGAGANTCNEAAVRATRTPAPRLEAEPRRGGAHAGLPGPLPTHRLGLTGEARGTQASPVPSVRLFDFIETQPGSKTNFRETKGDAHRVRLFLLSTLARMPAACLAVPSTWASSGW